MTPADIATLEKKAGEILQFQRLGQSYATDYHKDVLWLLSEVRRLREALDALISEAEVVRVEGHSADFVAGLDAARKALEG